MDKVNLDWSNIGFAYHKTPVRYISDYKNGKWDDGELITDDKVVISECARRASIFAIMF